MSDEKIYFFDSSHSYIERLIQAGKSFAGLAFNEKLKLAGLVMKEKGAEDSEIFVHHYMEDLLNAALDIALHNTPESKERLVQLTLKSIVKTYEAEMDEMYQEGIERLHEIEAYEHGKRRSSI